MPLTPFLFLFGVFLIGTMANIAGNAFGNYLSFLAVCFFSVLMLISELKRERFLPAKNRRIRCGNMAYSELMAIYLIMLTNLAIDWPYATSVYLLVAILLIVFRLAQTMLVFVLLMFRRTNIRQFRKLMVFTCIDIIFHSPETCRQEAAVLNSGDFEGLTRIKSNLISFWSRHGKSNLLMSSQTPFITHINCRMNSICPTAF